MWEWIQSLTLFNWLSMIAFIFLPLSVLNSFLGLRSKYKDWRATKNKNNFEGRLYELKQRFNKIKDYRESTILIIDLIDEAIQIAMCVLVALTLFSMATYFYFAFPEGYYWSRAIAAVTMILGQAFITFAILLLAKLTKLISHIRNPAKLAKEIIKLIIEGKSKNLIPNDTDLLESIVNSDLFTEHGKYLLKKHVDKYEILNK